MAADTILSVRDLTVAFHTRNGNQTAVRNLSFDLAAGEILAIVGESGSGKSVSCYSLLGLIPMPPGKIEQGSAHFQGSDLLVMSEQQLRKIRGRKISMIFQDPMTSLNPYLHVSRQLMEPLQLHLGLSKNEARKRAIAALEEVGIRDAEKRIDDYPHQFSGGMRQRVMIAMALITEPELLIADEPTTALDVTVQAQILTLIRNLQASRNLSVIFITHDLGVAASLANRVLVMQAGEVVESGAIDDVFHRPQHPYTQKLLHSILTTGKENPLLLDAAEAPLLEVKALTTSYEAATSAWFRRAPRLKGIENISLQIGRGEIVGIVGESGSGKSTLGRTIMQLLQADSGEVLLEGKDLCQLQGRELNKARHRFQMIFQDPYASLNPRMTVFDTLAEPLREQGKIPAKEISTRVNQLMDDVGLDRRFIRKYPHEFSGGQRQRIAIARALALQPELIVADEPVSALDVTIRAQILELLLQLTQKHSLTLLFISHDMSVVRYLCDRIVVMQKGEIVEQGSTELVFTHPQQEYTRSLLAAIPKMA